MPKFKVWITSDEPLKAKESLDEAQIPTIGPSFAKFVDAPGDWSVGLDITAVLEADDAEDAERRVRRAAGRPEASVHEVTIWE